MVNNVILIRHPDVYLDKVCARERTINILLNSLDGICESLMFERFEACPLLLELRVAIQSDDPMAITSTTIEAELNDVAFGSLQLHFLLFLLAEIGLSLLLNVFGVVCKHIGVRLGH